MKKYLITTLVLALTLSSTSVFANKMTGTTSNEINNRQKILNNVSVQKEQMKEKIASTSAQIKEKEVQLKKEVEQKLQDRISLQKSLLLKGFDVAISTLNSLATRTESRIEKLDFLSIDTSSSTLLLSIAKNKIFAAQTEVNTLTNLVSQNVSSSTTKLAKAQIKTESDKAKNAIKSAKDALVKTIASIEKSMEKRNSTSTVATSTQ